MEIVPIVAILAGAATILFICAIPFWFVLEIVARKQEAKTLTQDEAITLQRLLDNIEGAEQRLDSL